VIERPVRYASGFLAGAALLTECVAAATRYVAPAFTVDWADEVVILLLVWAMFLSGHGVTVERRHIAVDLLQHVCTKRTGRLLTRISMLFLAAFAALMLCSGVLVVVDAVLLGEHSESTARLPTWLYYAALPAGMLLILIGILAIWRSEDPPEQP
jgi:C4-dicarboxylate transporter, DctQ subunit